MEFWLESIFQRAQGVCKSSLVVFPPSFQKHISQLISLYFLTLLSKSDYDRKGQEEDPRTVPFLAKQ